MSSPGLTGTSGGGVAVGVATRVGAGTCAVAAEVGDGTVEETRVAAAEGTMVDRGVTAGDG